MSTHEIAPMEHAIDDKTMFSLVTEGDAGKLSDAQKLAYYKARCEAAGLDPRAQPFQFIKLNGKLVLYALKACTDQLAAKHGIRCEILSQATEEGIRVVTVRAIAADGRQTDEIGAVSVKGLQGDALCNALMRATTKAKRRAILAVCGLGMLDETELETTGAAPPQPVVQMPRRLSEKQQRVLTDEEAMPAFPRGPIADNEPIPMDELGLALRCLPPADEDLTYKLMASVEAVNAKADEAQVANSYITDAQRKRLFAIFKASCHTKEQVSAWLASGGIMSSKQIPASEYEAICRRLEDQTPLEA